MAYDEVLADGETVHRTVRLLGLRPRGTLAFLFDALAGGDIDFDGFLEQLERLMNHGFYLDEGIYLKAVRRSRSLADE